MCGEYWRCYPNPGIGRHNTRLDRKEQITINISEKTPINIAKNGYGGQESKSELFFSVCWPTNYYHETENSKWPLIFERCSLRWCSILITNYKLWANVFSFQKIAVWVGGDYVGGHILWWGQLRDGGELRGRGRITAYIGHFVNICNWKRIKNWSGKYSSMFFPSSGLRHLSLGLLHSVFSYSHPDAKMRDLFVTASLNDTPV